MNDTSPTSPFPWEDEPSGGRAEAEAEAEADAEAEHTEAIDADAEAEAEAEAEHTEAIDADAAAAPAEAAPDVARRADTRRLVRKEYYAISEVSELVGLPAHVLRYWESQFAVLNPSKNRSGNRVYQRKEIRVILLVKQLLYEDKYTVEGAKQRLDQLRRGGDLASAASSALDEQTISALRDELRTLAELLAPDAP
ncbi:MAG TPA: MerR family transcriptional regulator [Longimicrobiales bacterium]|nr:MerR family transcriptional regulator [Longimicrobiales bacterium]